MVSDETDSESERDTFYPEVDIGSLPDPHLHVVPEAPDTHRGRRPLVSCTGLRTRTSTGGVSVGSSGSVRWVSGTISQGPTEWTNNPIGSDLHYTCSTLNPFCDVPGSLDPRRRRPLWSGLGPHPWGTESGRT